jgi:hypothetical protein
MEAELHIALYFRTFKFHIIKFKKCEFFFGGSQCCILVYYKSAKSQFELLYIPDYTKMTKSVDFVIFA